MKQHFFLEGKYLGCSSRYPLSRTGASTQVYSYAFLCPRCGELWARCPTSEPETPWHFIAKECRKHGRANVEAAGGSIWLSWEPEFLEAFTDAVLRWEFDRHLETWERIHE